MHDSNVRFECLRLTRKPIQQKR